MDPTSLDEIRQLLGRYPRRCGYYLVDAVSLPTDWRANEGIALRRAFEVLDDQPWKPVEDRVTDPRWVDYEVPEAVAESHAIQMLIGGPEIGHTDLTMSEARAREIWRTFRGLFTSTARFFTGLGFGDPQYVFLNGAVVVDEATAACLCVIESD